MSDIPKLIVITGPTATGKTALGVQVAKLLDGEVIGADSMQIYEGMAIGTAAPAPEEMEGIPHHMIGFADPRDSYSVSRYVEDAAKIAEDVIARGKVPVVVGGTGLYIETSLNAIADGSKTVDIVNDSINRVVEGIELIAQSSKSISEMANDQAEAMKQAELGVNQISEVVQSNSATAEESSATSEELSAQATTMDSLISKFKLPTIIE